MIGGQDGGDVLVFGHRGAAGEAPENTMAGFAHACAMGVMGLEMDARLSADGWLVLSHDASLLRTAGVRGSIRDFSADQLSELDVRRTCPWWPEPAGVPKLRDVLHVFPDREAYQIEIKSDDAGSLDEVVRLVTQEIRRAGIDERTTVTSFDPVALEMMRDRAPDLARGFISRYDRAGDLRMASELACAVACVPLATGSEEIVRMAHDEGMSVTGWLGNAPADVETLVRWGVDSITSDVPSRVLRWLGSGTERQVQDLG